MSPNPKQIPMVYDTVITMENPPLEAVVPTAQFNKMMMMSTTTKTATATATSTTGAAVPVTEQNQLRVRWFYRDDV
jgi:hypothetical protein